MVRMPGAWKTFEELEDCLTLEELEILLDKARDVEYKLFKMHAALQGHDLGDASGKESNEDRFKRIEREALAKLQGISEEELELRDVGITIIREGE